MLKKILTADELWLPITERYPEKDCLNDNRSLMNHLHCGGKGIYSSLYSHYIAVRQTGRTLKMRRNSVTLQQSL